jgi:transposase
MSKEKLKIYPSEFRESSVKLAIESDQSIAQTARDLGVNPNTLHGWISKYSKPNASQPATNRTDEHLYDELKRLKKENARLKEERDILKKAAAYFAQEIR